MELSKRLRAIADMVTKGSRVADVGCDHGFVSIYLVQRNISPRVYAMDVRQGPLLRAKEHIEEYGLSEYIETRLSDGVKALLPNEADTLICAGMGGRLMVKILSEGYDKVIRMRELILQPQSELSFFRRYLRTHGLRIVKEDMIKEEGKFYTVMKVTPEKGDSCTQEEMQAEQNVVAQRRQDCFGPCLLKEKNAVLLEYLLFLKEKNEKILKELDAKRAGELRRQELSRELMDIMDCISYYKGGRDTL